MDRAALKERGRSTFKHHYWLIVIICLLAAFLGVQYTESLWVAHLETDNNMTSITSDPSADASLTDGTDASTSTDVTTTNSDNDDSPLDLIFKYIFQGNDDAAHQQVKENESNISKNDTNAALGHSRGVFASMVNSVASGSIFVSTYDAIRSIAKSNSIAIGIFIILSLVIYLFFWLFIQKTYLVVSHRMVLEARTYEKVPLRRFLYPIRSKAWLRIAWTMLVEWVMRTLWWLTVVGGVIKTFSYAMTPYIIAENPNMKATEAITLSRRMMQGHKWELFKLQLSFLGWYILSFITLGLSGIFWSNGFHAATIAEYYAYVRGMAKSENIEGTDQLNDTYLYKKPSQEQLDTTYSDAKEALVKVDDSAHEAKKPTGFFGALSEWFGIRLGLSKEVDDWELHKAQDEEANTYRNILAGKVYPGRLSPVPATFKVNVTTQLGAGRSYSLLNLIMMFFIFSFVGWLWEVTVAFISEGVFVNRGTMHGPWLPIYGFGGLIILVLLKKLREKPVALFIGTVILCGCLEYGSSWVLEKTHNGQRWWDYSGYFLNLNGRICAEGLLVFGLGGLAITYVLGPALDNLLNKVNRKALLAIAVVLLVVYVGDQIYSAGHPNIGTGITDTGEKTAQVTSGSSS